jgi:hypothetical protein
MNTAKKLMTVWSKTRAGERGVLVWSKTRREERGRWCGFIVGATATL